MGVTYITVILKNPKGGKKMLKRRFLVDTGAVYSVVPKSVLETIGIKPHSTRAFILANGEEIERKVGDGTFIVGEKQASSPVIFGDEKVFLLGVVTLESLGMIVDPISRTIKPLPMMI